MEIKGLSILRELSVSATPSIMELSGMDPALICPDAALDLTVRALAWGMSTNSGQTCVAARRLIVHKDIHDSFTAALVRSLQSLHVGDPMDPQTEVGPLRSLSLYHNLNQLIQDALTKGATLVTGGSHWEKNGKGFFEPTILSGVRDDMAVMQQEYVGPLAVIQQAESIEEMIHLANRSAWGLGASIWSCNLIYAQQMARQLDTGNVWINDLIFPVGDIRVSFGGVKASGFGRVGGEEGLKQLTNAKWVEVCRPRGFRPYYHPYTLKKFKQLKSFMSWRHS